MRKVRIRPLEVRENEFRNHAVHALADVHHLGDAAIDRHRDEAVGFIPARRNDFLVRQPIDSFARGIDHGDIEVLGLEAGRDPVRAGFDEWPADLHVLAHDRLDTDFLVRALERLVRIDLAVSLAAVRIAGPDETASLKYRKEMIVEPSCSSLMSMFEPFFHGRRVETGASGSSFTPPFRGARILRVDFDRKRAQGRAVESSTMPGLNSATVRFSRSIGKNWVLSLRALGGERPDRREFLAGRVRSSPPKLSAES